MSKANIFFSTLLNNFFFEKIARRAFNRVSIFIVVKLLKNQP